MNLGSALGLSQAPGVASTALAMGDTLAQGMFSAKQASLQRDWQENMANTAFQRRAQDLSAAGLNPILAATQGPASVPSGAMAATPSSNMVGAFFSAAQAAQAMAMARKTNAEARVTELEADVADERKKALGKGLDPSGLLGSLPSPIQPTAKALSEALRSGAETIFGLLPDGSEDVERMLKGATGVARTPSSAVEAGRARGVGVLPGGAVVGRPIPGQLNILRLKRGER